MCSAVFSLSLLSFVLSYSQVKYLPKKRSQKWIKNWYLSQKQKCTIKSHSDKWVKCITTHIKNKWQINTSRNIKKNHLQPLNDWLCVIKNVVYIILISLSAHKSDCDVCDFFTSQKKNCTWIALFLCNVKKWTSSLSTCCLTIKIT